MVSEQSLYDPPPETGAGVIRRRIAGIVTVPVPIFRVPVVGAGCRVGVFNLIHDALVWIGPSVVSRREDKLVIRWHGGISVAIAEPDRVGVAKHDVIGACASKEGLVEVIADGVLIGQALEVGSIALLHVVESEGGRSFAGGLRVGTLC